jgi:hypothetical protein
MSRDRKPWGRLAGTGILSALLYALLFAYEADVMASFTRTDGLYPLLPIVTAFVFSFAHGAFTASFWEVLGVRPRTTAHKGPGKVEGD